MFIRMQITTVFALVVLFFSVNSEKKNGTIYVLIWTITEGPWWYYRDLDNEEGHVAFVSRNCSFQNCYLTPNRTYFESVLQFEVLVFNAVHLSHGYENPAKPTQRSPSQLYVLFSVEPAVLNLIPDIYDGFFNLTWTYMLSSDIVHPHFLIKNNIGNIIGPMVNVHWLDIKNMSTTDATIIQKIERKSIAALWVASNCAQRRRLFVHSLYDELSKYGHHLDIYGRCGDPSKCQISTGESNGRLTDDCYSRIKSDYYFYLAFENSFSEDYVSEKVLHGLLHFSVPIVYGGANYSRFLPDGIYLNALELGVDGLAREMNNIINNRQRYYDFFKWHNYYSFHDTLADDYRDTVCEFCASLNDMLKFNATQVYENITGWWNANYAEQTLDPPTTASTTASHFGQIAESPIETITTNIISKIIDVVSDFD